MDKIVCNVVSAYHYVDENQKKFVGYEIRTNFQGITYQKVQRYSNFATHYSYWCKLLGDKFVQMEISAGRLKKFPPKNFLTKFSKNTIKNRKIIFNSILNYFAEQNPVARDISFLKFVGILDENEVSVDNVQSINDHQTQKGNQTTTKKKEIDPFETVTQERENELHFLKEYIKEIDKEKEEYEKEFVQFFVDKVFFSVINREELMKFDLYTEKESMKKEKKKLTQSKHKLKKIAVQYSCSKDKFNQEKKKLLNKQLAFQNKEKAFNEKKKFFEKKLKKFRKNAQNLQSQHLQSHTNTTRIQVKKQEGNLIGGFDSEYIEMKLEKLKKDLEEFEKEKSAFLVEKDEFADLKKKLKKENDKELEKERVLLNQENDIELEKINIIKRKIDGEVQKMVSSKKALDSEKTKFYGSINEEKQIEIEKLKVELDKMVIQKTEKLENDKKNFQELKKRIFSQLDSIRSEFDKEKKEFYESFKTETDEFEAKKKKFDIEKADFLELKKTIDLKKLDEAKSTLSKLKKQGLKNQEQLEIIEKNKNEIKKEKEKYEEELKNRKKEISDLKKSIEEKEKELRNEKEEKDKVEKDFNSVSLALKEKEKEKNELNKFKEKIFDAFLLKDENSGLFTSLKMIIEGNSHLFSKEKELLKKLNEEKSEKSAISEEQELKKKKRTGKRISQKYNFSNNQLGKEKEDDLSETINFDEIEGLDEIVTEE